MGGHWSISFSLFVLFVFVSFFFSQQKTAKNVRKSLANDSTACLSVTCFTVWYALYRSWAEKYAYMLEQQINMFSSNVRLAVLVHHAMWSFLQSAIYRNQIKWTSPGANILNFSCSGFQFFDIFASQNHTKSGVHDWYRHWLLPFVTPLICVILVLGAYRMKWG